MNSKRIRQTDENLTPDNPKVRLAEALEHLSIMLSAEMKELRIEKRGLTQQDVADQLGVDQSWISKVESSTYNSRIENILKYLKALEADFVVGILDGDEFLPVSEAAEEWWSDVEKSKTSVESSES